MINICKGYAADYNVIVKDPNSQFVIFKGNESVRLL